MARAPINPATLSWAREISRVSTVELAKSVGVKPERIIEFETGDAAPTFRQLTLLATKLDRPLGFFFAAPPSKPDIPDTADYRGRVDHDIPSDLAKEIRRAEKYREAMLDLSGPAERKLSGGPITWQNIPAEATRLRQLFGLTDVFVPPESTNSQVFNFWRGLLEQHGALVLQTTKISLEAFRGLSIHHNELPVIVVNGGDSPAGRTFTLFHEVAHLINRISGLCVLKESVDEEAIANNFAASFLMPERTVRAHVSEGDDALDLAAKLASHFKVSNLAAGVRLRRLNVIDDEDLDLIRATSDEVWKKAREANSKKNRFVPPWRLRYRDLGPTYIGAVARALEEQRADLVDATYLFNARLPMVEQLLSEYYRAGGGE